MTMDNNTTLILALLIILGFVAVVITMIIWGYVEMHGVTCLSFRCMPSPPVYPVYPNVTTT